MRLDALIFCIVSAVSARAAVIDFDAVYGSATGWTLVQHIDAAVDSASPGDIIQFNGTNYNFEGQGLSIDNAVTLRGIVPASFDPDTVGATNVTTVFDNLKHLNVYTSDFTLQHLELREDTSTAYAFNRFKRTIPEGEDAHQFYTNIVVENVIYRGGQVQAYGGDGAGIEFRNTSFLEFRAGGYYINRKNRIDYAPRVVMRKCFFQPDFSALNFNVRAVSLDAGNSEYPVIWDQRGMTVESCLLDGTGLGVGSKVSNVVVTNCHFLGYRMDVDMIHFEEFGGDAEVVGNIFEHVSPARSIYIDRELQQNHDIRISGNTWIGEYGWIISCYSPEGLVFENNDFTGAWAKNATDVTIDLTYLHTASEQAFLPYDLPCSDILFTNNTGLTAAKDGFLAFQSLYGDDSVQIDYPAGKVRQGVIAEAPRSVFSKYKLYRIKNKQTGEYVAAIDGTTELGMIAGPASDDSDLWAITYRYPYYYHLQNVKTGKYMETESGYTLGDLNNNNQDQRFVEQLYSYDGKADLPFWYFRKHDSGTGAFYEIFPGSNERKSRVVQVGNKVEIEFSEDVPEQDSSWMLESIDFGLPAEIDAAGPQVVLSVSNAPIKSWFALLSKTNLHDAAWTTNQTDLYINELGSGAVTNPISYPNEFFMLVETEPPPVPVIEFTLPDYTNGMLNLHPLWNAESGWTVEDDAGSGHILTGGNSQAAVLNEPVILTPGQKYSLSINLQFDGAYSTPSAYVYTFLGGLKPDAAGASVGTGEAAAADANIQISSTDMYRLLNNYSQIGDQITSGPLDAGDSLQFDYELTLGLDAAGTSYTARLQNLTDGTDTGIGTVNGVDASLYNALTGSGAFGFFQSIHPGNNGSGLSGVQVHSIVVNRVP